MERKNTQDKKSAPQKEDTPKVLLHHVSAEAKGNRAYPPRAYGISSPKVLGSKITDSPRRVMGWCLGGEGAGPTRNILHCVN